MHSSRLRPRLALAAAASVAAAAGAVLLSTGPATRGELAATTADPRPSAATGGSVVDHRATARSRQDGDGAVPGTRLHYQLDDRTEIATTGEAAPARLARVHTSVEVDVTVLDRRAGEVLLRAQLDPPTFRDGDERLVAPGDRQRDRYVAAAATAVTMRTSTSGQLLGFGFAPELDGEQRNFLRGLLGTFAFQLRDGVASWEASEADTTGEYLARYVAVPAVAGEARTFRRTKLRYTAMAGGVTPHRLDGSAEARFGRDAGWPASVHANETTVTDLPVAEVHLSVHRTFTLSLSNVTAVPVSGDLEAIWAATVDPVAGHHEGAADGAARAEAEASAWRERLLGVGAAQLLAELRAIQAARPIDGAALALAFERLTWFGRLDASAARALAGLVVAGQVDDDLIGAVLGALAAAGTEAAQEALLQVRSEVRLSLAVRDTAQAAMLDLAQPVPAVLEALTADIAGSGDLRLGAALVLGALAPRCREPLCDGRPALATFLALEPEMQRRGELATWMLALGNTRSDAIFGAARRHADSPDAAIRAAVCTALGKVTSPAATDLLIERGRHDLEPGVRAEAISRLGKSGEPRAAAAVRQAARADAHADVRRAAVEMLARAGSSEDLDLLRAIATSDPDAGIRDLAHRALQ